MGFPVGYTQVFIPTLFIHTLTFLTFLKKLLNTLFNYLGLLPDSLEPDPIQNPNQPDPTTPPLSALVLRELLPLSRVPHNRAGDRCVICLYELYGGEEIRWLSNCKHVFHKECLDRWMDLDHTNCPLCRTPFLRDRLLREFNQRLLLDHDNNHDYCHDRSSFDHHFVYVDSYYSRTEFSTSF